MSSDCRYGVGDSFLAPLVTRKRNVGFSLFSPLSKMGHVEFSSSAIFSGECQVLRCSGLRVPLFGRE